MHVISSFHDVYDIPMAGNHTPLKRERTSDLYVPTFLLPPTQSSIINLVVVPPRATNTDSMTYDFKILYFWQTMTY